MSKSLSFLLGLFALCFCATALLNGNDIYIAETDGKQSEISKNEQNLYEFNLLKPGAALFFKRADRLVLRHDREIFKAEKLEIDVIAFGKFKKPLKAWVFVKDKDGAWFQSEEEFALKDGIVNNIAVTIDELGRNMLPLGHSGAWNASVAAVPFEVGVSIWTDEEVEGGIEIMASGIRFTGERKQPPLAITSWELPEKAAKNEMFESRFTLSREYFNAFDPEEIKCDYEIELPGNKFPVNVPLTDQFFVDGKISSKHNIRLNMSDFYKAFNTPEPEKLYNLRFPAFFTQDYERFNHMTREHLRPLGKPYWAFRMTPFQTGKVRVRLRIEDNSTEEKQLLFSDWREIEIVESNAKGPIRVSNTNAHLFEFTDGSPYFPVSLNIHANTDLRSEFKFKWGHLPDRGSYDFDDYFNACAQKGSINMIEIWMASWTYAIEWDAARQFYYGVGRYNMANAWKLDHLLETSRKNGIYLNLVLDSHGKLSFRNDQEWNDNPFNTKAAFSVANGAILEKPRDYWVDFESQKMNLRRNRYIAARWGADPNVFAFEFWSEVDLCDDAWTRHRQGYLEAWHRNAAKELSAMSQAVKLYATHTCGNGSNTLGWKTLTCLLPELTHIAGDAYRSPSVNYVDQTRSQSTLLKEFNKPMLVTEYGGTAFGSGENNILGDVHAGLWGAYFMGQGGSPALWWHDFVHIRDHYKHYKGFASFIENEDIRGDGKTVWTEARLDVLRGMNFLDFYNGEVTRKNYLPVMTDIAARRKYTTPIMNFAPEYDKVDSAFISPSKERLLGWIYYKDHMLVYPDSPDKTVRIDSARIPIGSELAEGSYQIRFFDTVSGNEVYVSTFRHDGNSSVIYSPSFKIDTAFKISRIDE